MSRKTNSGLPKAKTFTCKRLTVEADETFGVAARHHGIPGYDQSRMSRTSIVVIGAGGLGSEIGEGSIRKGPKRLTFYDHDQVEPSNLNRQFFTDKDLYKYKAPCLAKNLSAFGFLGTVVIGVPRRVEDSCREILSDKPDVIVCGVDNDQARVVTAKLGHDLGCPVITTAVSTDGDQGYVFVQLPGQACFGCLMPDAVGNTRMPCPGTPAIKDILKVVSGLVLYAVDSVLMARERNWNYRLVRLAGFAEDIQRTVERNPDCPLCGGEPARG